VSQLTISLPDALDAELEKRASAAGFTKQDYLLELLKADCKCAQLEAVLAERYDGPFEPLDGDWKQRVRCRDPR
jgi:hypothetical protein